MNEPTQETDFIDRLGEMFELQGDLQRKAYGSHPGDIELNEEKIQFYKDMHIAIISELQEALDEIGWKPWASSRHINAEAVQGELVDAFHFFMNLCMTVNMTPDILFEKYKIKRGKNIKRQEEGYDGVSTKCPACKRALDDDAVHCTLRSDDLGGYCDVRQNDFIIYEGNVLWQIGRSL